MMQRDRLIFIAITFFILLYVILRAALIPWVHDESASIYWYVERGEFLPYDALWDAGNHFLSTAIGILGYQFWGLSLPGSRIGSILAFPLYAWAIYRIGSHIQQRSTRWILWLALISCPFVLDFFSLFRGYGMSMAFFMVAVDGSVRYFRSRREVHLAQLLLGMALADLAILSLVPLWALIVAATAFLELIGWRRAGTPFPFGKAIIWCVLGAIPLMIGLLLAWEMRRRGLLYHGSTEGLFEVTINSLSRYVLGTGNMIVTGLASMIIIGAGLVAFIKKPVSYLLPIAGIMLGADLLMRVAMATLLHVNYPEDRAALHMVPLAILLVGGAADRMSSKRFVHIAFILPLIVPTFRSIWTLDLDHTLMWPEQSVPTRFLRTIGEMQRETKEPIVIGAYHQLGFAIPYAARLHNITIPPPDVINFPQGYHEVRIVDDRFYADAIEGYTPVDRSQGNGLHLLVRNDMIKTVVIDKSTLEPVDNNAEFIELWTNTEGVDGPSMRAEVRAAIHSDVDRLNMFLVVSQTRNDSSLYHHAIPLSHYRLKWSGEELWVMLNVPAVGADRQVVYFWNQDKVQIRMNDLSVAVHRIIE